MQVITRPGLSAAGLQLGQHVPSVHVLTVPQQLLLLSAVDYGFTPLTAVVHASHTQALHSAAKESLRMLYYMPGLGRQINKLDTDKAILAAPDYNCEHQLSKYQHAAAALGAVMQHRPNYLPLPTSTDGWHSEAQQQMLSICCASFHTTPHTCSMRPDAQ
jgi:hypothetical protein